MLVSTQRTILLATSVHVYSISVVIRFSSCLLLSGLLLEAIRV